MKYKKKYKKHTTTNINNIDYLHMTLLRGDLGHLFGYTRRRIRVFFRGYVYIYIHMYGPFHKWGYPKIDGFIMEHPFKMDDDWGYPHFRKPQIYIQS